MISSESSSETIAIIALVVALGTNFPDRVIKPSINIIGFLPLTKEFVAGVTPCMQNVDHEAVVAAVLDGNEDGWRWQRGSRGNQDEGICAASCKYG